MGDIMDSSNTSSAGFQLQFHIAYTRSVAKTAYDRENDFIMLKTRLTARDYHGSNEQHL